MTLHPFSRRSRQPEFDGDFPDDSRTITEVLDRVPDWDASAITFGGASIAALDPDLIPRIPPAQPPPRHRPADDGSAVIARSMTPGWRHLFELRCGFPAAACATPIPCGTVHHDDAAGSFRDLRRSAQAAGWHLDALGRWACPACCQHSPDYRTLYPFTHWHPAAAAARQAGDPAAEFWFRVEAELDMLTRTAESAVHGRHEAGAR